MNNYTDPETIITIDIVNDGSRLDRFLKSKKVLPYSLIQKGLRQGMIRVNGRKVKGNILLKSGDNISLGSLTPQQEQREILGPPARLLDELGRAIMTLKQRYFVLNKPAGIPVQAGMSQDYSIDDLMPLTRELGDERPVKIVHRLDKDTTGCLLIARTRAAAEHFAAQFKYRQIQKQYLCLCRGIIKETTGVVDLALRGNRNKGMKVDADGREAQTHFTVLGVNKEENVSFVVCMPISGRKHQIRAHMAHIGHPLRGDELYNKRNKKSPFCLHAASIQFKDLDGKTVRVTAPLPLKFLNQITKLGFQDLPYDDLAPIDIEELTKQYQPELEAEDDYSEEYSEEYDADNDDAYDSDDDEEYDADEYVVNRDGDDPFTRG